MMRSLNQLSASLSQRLLREARIHYRTAVALVGMLLLTVVVTLPFTVSSIWDEMAGSPEGEVRRIGPPAEVSPDVAHGRLHVALVANLATISGGVLDLLIFMSTHARTRRLTVRHGKRIVHLCEVCDGF